MKQNREYSEEKIFNIFMVGSFCAGKQKLIIRYCDDEYNDISETSESRFRHIDYIQHKTRLDGFEMVARWWPLHTNAMRFKLCPKEYTQANVIVINFDLTNTETFDEIPKWVDHVRTHCPKDCPLILVGNKVDLLNERKITNEQIEELKKTLNIPLYFEASAKNNTGVTEVCRAACEEALKIENLKQPEKKPQENSKPIKKQNNSDESISEKILSLLKENIKRVDGKFGKNRGDFKFPFWAEERGIQREINCELMKYLREEVQKIISNTSGAKNLYELFNEAALGDKRGDCIKSLGARDRIHSRTGKKIHRETGINSSGLNNIIKLAQNSNEFANKSSVKIKKN